MEKKGRNEAANPKRVRYKRAAAYPPAIMTARHHYFPEIDDLSWNDWRWQLAHRLTSFDELSRYFTISSQELAGLKNVANQYQWSLTPHLLSLMDAPSLTHPIARQFIPDLAESISTPLGGSTHSLDPLNENEHSPVPGVIHRYRDRAVLLVASHCAAYCR